MAEEPQNAEQENGVASEATSSEAAAVDIESSAFAELPWEEQVETLREILNDSRGQTAHNLDLAQRAQAEMANQKRRSDEERITQGKFSNSRLIAKLLPVVEELALAVDLADGQDSATPASNNASADSQSTESSWLQGVRLIQRKLTTLLESEGVTEIDSAGAVFNPLEHEALGTDESNEYPSGHIVKTVRQGYRLHDRVIQPAQVIVAQ